MSDINPAIIARQSGLLLWPQPACLLENLRAHLCATYGANMQKICILLPNQRLRVLLLGGITQQQRAVFAPHILTIEQYAEEIYLLASANPDRHQVASKDLLKLLMRRTIAGFKSKHIRRQHADECLQLYRELTQHQITPAAFAATMSAVVRSDIYRSEIHLDTLSERFAELHSLLDTFEQQLQERGLKLREQIIMAGTQLLATEPQIFLGRHEWLYIVGLTSNAPYLNPLLRTLATHPRASFWLSQPTTATSITTSTPLSLLVDEVKQHAPATHVITVPSPTTQPVTCIPTAIDCHNPIEEVEVAVRLAADVIARGTTAPSKIAILVPDEAAYASLLRSWTAALHLPCNIALTVPLAQTPFGIWLSTLLHCYRDDCTTQSLIAFSTLDLTTAVMRRQPSDNNAQSDSRSATTLAKQLIRSGVYQDVNALRRHPALQDCRSDLDALLQAGAPFLPTPDGTRHPSYSLRQWRAWLEELQNTYEQTYRDRPGERAAVKETLEGFFAQLRLTYAHTDADDSGLSISIGDFADLLQNELLQRPIRDVGEPLLGVQIISLTEARYAPFELVILLGCNEGTFPKSLPRDDLVDDYLKRRAGLPGWQALEALESTTFALLEARLSQLVMTYCRHTISGRQVRSRFLDDLERTGRLRALNAGELTCFTRDKSTTPKSVASEIVVPTPITSFTPQGDFHGDRTTLLGTLSASSFESLLRCPYRFLLGRLGVQALELPFAADEPRALGKLLHAIFEAFFVGAKRGSHDIAPLPANIDADTWLDFGLRRFAQITELLAPRDFRESFMYYHLSTFGWPRFLLHVQKLYVQDGNNNLGNALNGWREFNLKQPTTGAPLPLIPLAGTPTQISGIIDAIDFISGATLLTDYKNSRVRSDELKLGLSPQLAFYAQILEHLPQPINSTHLLGGFWIIQAGEWHTFAVGDDARHTGIELGLASNKTPSWNDRWAIISERLQQRRDELLKQRQTFAADSSFCGFCQYDGVCRRDDPAYVNEVNAARRIAAAVAEKKAAQTEVVAE